MRARNSSGRIGWAALWVLGIVLGVAGCGPEQSGPQSGGAGLAWALAHQPKVQVQCFPAQLGGSDRVLQALDRIRAEGALDVLAPDPEQEDSKAARLVVGLASEPRMQSLLGQAGISRMEGLWSVRGMGIPDDRAWVTATWRDTERGGLPLTILCAVNERVLAIALQHLRVGTWPSMRVYRGAYPILQADLTSGGQVIEASVIDCRPWHLQPAKLAAARQRRLGRFRTREQPACDAEQVEAYAQAVEATWQRLETWAGPLAPKAPVLYAQSDAYHWARGEAPNGWCQVDPFTDALQVLLMPGGLGDGGASAGAAYLETALGPPSAPWLAEACGVQAAQVYWGQQLGSWWGVLARLPNLPAPSAWIQAGAEQRHSPHCIVPLRALLVEMVLEESPSKLLELWHASPGAEAWAPWLDKVGERLGSLALQPEWAQPLAVAPDHGIGVALEGGLDPDALELGSEAHLALQREWQALGVQGLAYRLSLVAEPDAPLVRSLPWRGSKPLSDVRGEALLSLSLQHCARLGLTTGLTLEVWSRPSGIPMQDMVWPDRERIESFFVTYGQASLHALLLARLSGVAWVNLGDGMGEVLRTEARPSEANNGPRLELLALRRERWHELLTNLRPAFAGSMGVGVRNALEWPGTAIGEDVDAMLVPLRAPALDLAQAGGSSDRGLEQTWHNLIGHIEKQAESKPYVIWPLGLSLDGSEPGSNGGSGVPAYAERLPQLWRILGQVLAHPQGRGPAWTWLGPLDLAGEPLDPGEAGGRLSRRSLLEVLQGASK